MKTESNYAERSFPQMEKIFAGGVEANRLLSAVESSARKLESLSNVPDPSVSRPAKPALMAYAHLARLIEELRAAAPSGATTKG